MHFLLPPLILHLYTGCRLYQILSKSIASFKIVKSAKMLRIGVLFISQTLPYTFGACVRITPKIVTFVIGKMKLVSFSLFYMLSSSRPKMPFGQRHVAINIYSICKGHYGSRGGGGGTLKTQILKTIVEMFVHIQRRCALKTK